jgi:hypothetical protein
MHLESAYRQGLAPRLPQRLVRRYAIQSVHVVQAATDQRAYQTANRTAHGAADTGGFAQLMLWGRGTPIVRMNFPWARRHP